MSERLEAFARRVREVQKWKVLYGEKQRLLGKSLKNSTRLMIEPIQLERRKPADVRLVKVMPGLSLSRQKQILERLGASNATFSRLQRLLGIFYNDCRAGAASRPLFSALRYFRIRQ